MKQKNKKVYLEPNRRVIVAMSGGVDSSVAAALLKKQGYDVAGVFMRFWGEPQNAAELAGAEQRGNLCCSEGAEKAARAVAAKLKIPFYVFDFAKEFKKEVVDHFLREQKAGRTPNPCVVCNKKIKFGLMFRKALGLGVDFIATGHYARITPNNAEFQRGSTLSSAPFRIENENKHKKQSLSAETRRTLTRAKDENKDQSYFLYTLSQKQLSRILFPLGDYTKDEVYQLAKKWRLPYRKEESFDLCFVVHPVRSSVSNGASDAGNFISRHLKLKPGKILKYNASQSSLNNPTQPPLNLRPELSSALGGVGGVKKGGEGEVLGEHQGLPLYTVGQRKSIRVPQGPWWVVKKDERKNILYVSNNENDLYNDNLLAIKINWLSGKAPKLPAKVLVKIRYKSEASEATLRLVPPRPRRGGARSGRNLLVTFKKPQRAITPGQSVVFYAKSGEVLVGGGEIKNKN